MGLLPQFLLKSYWQQSTLRQAFPPRPAPGPPVPLLDGVDVKDTRSMTLDLITPLMTVTGERGRVRWVNLKRACPRSEHRLLDPTPLEGEGHCPRPCPLRGSCKRDSYRILNSASRRWDSERTNSGLREAKVCLLQGLPWWSSG